jgi:hypothetical protein
MHYQYSTASSLLAARDVLQYIAASRLLPQQAACSASGAHSRRAAMWLSGSCVVRSMLGKHVATTCFTRDSFAPDSLLIKV